MTGSQRKARAEFDVRPSPSQSIGRWQSLASFVFLLLLFGRPLTAQEAATFEAFPTNRELTQDLTRAQECLQEKRYGEAVQFLHRILEAPEDYVFQPERNTASFHSLKSEAQRLLGSMPSDGRQSYELQYGAVAQTMLDRAARDGDLAGLAEVSRRYFHTKAGYEATELLGTAHLEHGQPLSAAMCFKRLKEMPAAAQYEPLLSVKMALAWTRAGMPEQATESIIRLRQESPGAKITVAGQDKQLFDSAALKLFAAKSNETSQATTANLLAWLEQTVGPLIRSAALQVDQWPIFRGEPDRNAQSAGGSPLLNRRWAVATTGNPHLEKTVDQLRQAYLEHNQPLMPGTHPLAVRDLVFTRTLAGLVAVDFKTGKRIWRGSIDEGIRPILDQQVQDNGSNDSSFVATWLDRRIWDDTTYGTLSSDGQRIFCIEQVGNGAADAMRTVYNTNGRTRGQLGEAPTNRLTAYSIETEGKPVWDLGGRPVDENSELARAYFLGPPLPLDGRLYALVEIKGEIRLLCLDNKTLSAAAKTGLTGTPEWSQQLYYPERNIQQDPQRQLAGVSPSYSDGVLVCPTASGAVVAIDLTTRSLLWGYSYLPNNNGNPFAVPRFNAFQSGNSSVNENDRWADSTATISGGRVFLTPTDSNELYCLNLIDGKLLWKQNRGDGLYVGCVDNDLVFVVGRSRISALKVADGKSSWSNPNVALPAGSVPSGRGFYDGSRYYLPLSSAEVAAIDIKTGKTVAKAKSRSGSIAGNLICYQGAVISQGIDQLESFYQLDDLSRHVEELLAKNAADPRALALKGELLLDAGNLDQAVAQLRRSFELERDPRTQQLLVDALLEGLQVDFSKYRQFLPELEKLADQPAQQLAYLRQLASGLQQVGEIMPAFDTYMKIIAADAGDNDLERVDQTLSVRRDRWVQARLKNLRGSAPASEAAAIEKALRERLSQALAAKELEGLRTFIDYFGGDPLADEAREALLARLGPAASSIEKEHLLRRLEQSSDPVRARAAVAQMAQLLKNVGRLDEGAAYLARLEQWSDLPCLDGKLGREILADLGVDAGGEQLTRVDLWPTGAVEKPTIDRNQDHKLLRSRIEMRGPLGPFLARSSVEIDASRQLLVARGPSGRELWNLSLNDQRNDRNNVNIQPGTSHVRTSGHVVFAALGTQLVAIDTLSFGTQRQARVLWRQDLSDSLFNRVSMPVFAPQQRIVWGGQRFATPYQQQPAGQTGPVGGEFACFLRQRNLVAVHPLTGKTLWIRHGIQPGSDMFGDEEMLFVTQPNTNEALVLRTLDGQQLGRRPLPNMDQRLAVLGRKMLTWSIQNGRPVLALRDMWAEKELWKRPFSPEAKAAVFEDEAVGVLEFNGHFTLLSLPDGEVEVDSTVNAEPSLTDIFLLRSPTRSLLITNRPQQTGNGQVAISQQSSLTPLINGFVHGFDRRTGKLVFTTRVENRFLPFNQPADLPVLAFAANLPRQGMVFNGRGDSADGVLLCIDKRNGRVLVEDKSPGQVQALDMTGDLDTQQIIVRAGKVTVKLKFTSQAAGPEKKAAFSTRASRTLVRGLQSWVEKLSPAMQPIDLIVEPTR